MHLLCTHYALTMDLLCTYQPHAEHVRILEAGRRASLQLNLASVRDRVRGSANTSLSVSAGVSVRAHIIEVRVKG